MTKEAKPQGYRISLVLGRTHTSPSGIRITATKPLEVAATWPHLAYFESRKNRFKVEPLENIGRGRGARRRRVRKSLEEKRAENRRLNGLPPTKNEGGGKQPPEETPEEARRRELLALAEEHDVKVADGATNEQIEADLRKVLAEKRNKNKGGEDKPTATA